jgi:hypothetical protein
MPVGTPTGFGSNPARGTPATSRGGRTTAGGHRISHLRGGPSGGFTSKGRPIADFPRVFRALVQATEGLPHEAIRPLADALKFELDRQGGRYKLRGHQGKRFPLTARTQQAIGRDRKGRARYSSSRFVVGVPAGFWRIVEEGSNRHLIAGRYRKGSGRRFTAKGAFGAFTRGAERGDDEAFGRMGSPVNVLGHRKGQSREGWAQYVIHPGHGPIGRPWRRAMQRGDDLIAEIQKEYATRAFMAAWYR